MTEDLDWPKIREAVLSEKVFFNGNIRMCVVRVP